MTLMSRRRLTTSLLALAPGAALAQAAKPNANLEAAFKQWGVMNAQWLADNLKQPGWQATLSGLQYRQIVANPKGAAPTRDSSILVRYTTKLAKAGIIDSRKGEPLEMTVGSLLQGMAEAVMRMRTGETWDFAMPAELGYGDRSGPGRPAGSALFFHVTLLKAAK